MEQIGYSLIDAAGNEVAVYGDTKGFLRSPPEMIHLPNGDQVHCATPGEKLGDWKFVERWIDGSPPSTFHAAIKRTPTFDGTKIVVTEQYEPAPSLVPQSVSPRQARLALLAAGLLDQVEAAVTTAGGATKIAWDHANSIKRTDPNVLSVGARLAMTDSQIDDLFRAASIL